MIVVQEPDVVMDLALMPTQGGMIRDIVSNLFDTTDVSVRLA